MPRGRRTGPRHAALPRLAADNLAESPSWPGRASLRESDPLDPESFGPTSEAMLQVLKVGHEVRHGRVAEVLFLF